MLIVRNFLTLRIAQFHGRQTPATVAQVCGGCDQCMIALNLIFFSLIANDNEELQEGISDTYIVTDTPDFIE